LQIILAIVVICFTVPAIGQEPCCEGPFSIFRINSENWEPVIQDGPVFFFKNPTPGSRPGIVVAVVTPLGQIVRFGYLDDNKFRSFLFDATSQCYREEIIPPDVAEQMKVIILHILKELQC
jgi:hypothetical protein